MRLGEELRTRHYIDEGGRICGQSTGDGRQLREERRRCQAARQNPASTTTPLAGVLERRRPRPALPEPDPVILSFGRCSTSVRRSFTPVSRRRWPALCLAAAARGLPDLASSCNRLVPFSLEPQQRRSSRPPSLTTSCAPPAASERRPLPPASPAHRHKFAPAPPRPLLHARRQLLPPSSLPERRPISPSPSSVPPVAVEIAQAYEKYGAACLSILTDEKYFQGSFENLQKVRKAGVKCPLLCKVFVIDE